jgi:hypothetical protein
MWNLSSGLLSGWEKFTVWPLPERDDGINDEMGDCPEARWACVITCDLDYRSPNGSIKWRERDRGDGKWVDQEMSIDHELASLLRPLLENNSPEPFFDYLTERGFLPIV